MTDAKLVDLVKKIEAKTASGELKWEKTANVNLFLATLSNFVIRLLRYETPEEDSYTLSLVDKSGAELESISASELMIMYQALGIRDDNPFELMGRLFRNAKRAALGVDKVIDDILAELDDENRF